MENEELSKTKLEFGCTNCGNTIKPGEKMLTLIASLETPKIDGGVENLDDYVLSQVCSYCSSVLSNSLDVMVSNSETERLKAELNAHCSERGVVFDLHCSDGLSWENSTKPANMPPVPIR